MSEIAATATEEILATTNEDKLTPKQKDIQLSIFNIGQNLKYPMTLTSAHDFNSLMEILDDSKFKKSITQDKDALKESRDL
jgi:hypothetical protein